MPDMTLRKMLEKVWTGLLPFLIHLSGVHSATFSTGCCQIIGQISLADTTTNEKSVKLYALEGQAMTDNTT